MRLMSIFHLLKIGLPLKGPRRKKSLLAGSLAEYPFGSFRTKGSKHTTLGHKVYQYYLHWAFGIRHDP